MLLALTFAAALAGGDGVVLEAPGAAPHSPLRYHFDASGSQSAEIKVHSGVELSIMGKTQRVPTPEITVALSGTVLSVDEGTARVQVQYGDVQFTPTGVRQIDKALEKEVPKMSGIEGVMTLDDRGRSRSVELDLSRLGDVAREQTETALDVSQTLVPFPEQAIGVGARWSQSLTTEAQGLQIGSTVTYTLVDRSEHMVTIRSEVSQSLVGGKLEGLPIPLDVTGINGGGGGTITIDLRKPLPQSSDVRSKVEMALSASMMGMAMEGTQIIENSVTLSTVTP